MPNAATAGWDKIDINVFSEKTNAEIAELVGKTENAVDKKRRSLIRAGFLSLEEGSGQVFKALLQAQEERDLSAQLASRNKEIIRLHRELDIARRIDAGVRQPPKWVLAPQKKGVRNGIIVAQLTDTHFDEVVNPEEVGYINAYNRDIAEKRLKRWTERVMILSRDYVSGVNIEGINVLATGDLLSGDIHAELRESNEDTLYASADFWINRLIAVVEEFTKEFKQVHVGAVVGNHGRSTLKPVFKNRAKSNIEWLMWKQVARVFEGRDNITIQVGESMDMTVPIYGTNYLITHGDQFKGGSGISGAMSPLMLGQYRKVLRQAATDSPLDIMVMGHFHQYLTLPGLTVGGSMKGYDEYAYGLNLRPEPPQQAFWVTSPEYGPTISAPVFLSDRDGEGW